MAELKRIEELSKIVGADPTWVRGSSLVEDESEMHLSGQLRSIAEMLDANSSIKPLLLEVAERLDDAHLDWLEILVSFGVIIVDGEGI